MPAKFRVKTYREGDVYHICNRGGEGRNVFRNDEDFRKFENLLGSHEGVEILAYCLLTDHFHLLVRNIEERGITDFMRKVMTSYVMYFNKKYRRNGQLFENVYRAAAVPEGKVLAMTRFVHLNPAARRVRRFGLVEEVTGMQPEDYPYSSYRCYLGLKNYNWINKGFVKMSPNDYKKYMEEKSLDSDKEIEDLRID